MVVVSLLENNGLGRFRIAVVEARGRLVHTPG